MHRLTQVFSFCVILVSTFSSFGQTPNATSKQDTQLAEWQGLMPQLREMLEGAGHCPNEAKGMRVVQLSDITGDGIPEALVEYCHMGAYTSDLALMQIQNGNPAEARFRDEKGKTFSVGFLQGASVKNGEDTRLLPEKHAVYAIHWHTDDSGALAACTVDAYLWTPKTATFDLNSGLGKRIAKRECPQLQKELDCVAAACPK